MLGALLPLSLGAVASELSARSDGQKTIVGQPQSGLQKISLTIDRAGIPYHYRVEVASTPEEQAHGMMFRTEVPDSTGMIFPMKPAREVSFWMRNTLVPLDLLFIGRGGKILNIVENAIPLSEEPLSSKGPVIAVLELAGGEAARHGFRSGDKVKW